MLYNPIAKRSIGSIIVSKPHALNPPSAKRAISWPPSVCLSLFQSDHGSEGVAKMTTREWAQHQARAAVSTHSCISSTAWGSLESCLCSVMLTRAHVVPFSTLVISWKLGLSSQQRGILNTSRRCSCCCCCEVCGVLAHTVCCAALCLCLLFCLLLLLSTGLRKHRCAHRLL